MSTEKMEQKLAEFTAGHSFVHIDDQSLHGIKRNILDSYAGICASLRDRKMLEKFSRLAELAPDTDGVRVWGINKRARLPEALFMNAVLGRRSDLVNTYLSPDDMGGAHPSDTFSLVLTLADHLEKNGSETLAAVHLAYLLSCAFADYYNPQKKLYDHDAQAVLFLPLVIGSMMRLGIPQLIESQRIAGMMGLTTDQSACGEVTDWRHSTFGASAMQAVEAVNLARAGFQGAVDIYQGKAGIDHFFPHGKSILDPLPDLNTIIFKQWPALVFCQTPIDVAILVGQQIARQEAIEKIEVYTYQKALEVGAVPSARQPTCRAGRTHSIAYCVAAALIKKSIRYDFFDDDFIDMEPRVASLIQSVAVIEDPTMTRAFPQNSPCRIVVYLDDGSTVEAEKTFPHGDPKDPLNDQEIEEKVHKYLDPIIGPSHAEESIARIWELEREDNINFLIDPLKENEEE